MYRVRHWWIWFIRVVSSRKAYFEHPDYVSLGQSAYELWAELESAADVSLYEQTSLLLVELDIPLKISRKWLFWHEITTEVYDIKQAAPVFFFEREEGTFYGFPSIDGRTLKVAEHMGGEPFTEPDVVNVESAESEIMPIADFLQTALALVAHQA